MPDPVPAVTLALLSITTVPKVFVWDPLPYPAQMPWEFCELGCWLGPATIVPKFETKMKELDDCAIDDSLLLATIPVLPELILPVLITVILPAPIFVTLMPIGPLLGGGDAGDEAAVDDVTLALLTRSTPAPDELMAMP